jgi:ribosomal-protein-alanine N-acetyltransferase
VTLTRLLAPDDAPVLADLLRRNREFLAASGPDRDERFFTVAGQREAIEAALAQHERGASLPHVILGEAAGKGARRVVGRITLSSIQRGMFQSCNLGYWVNAADNGRGLASAAVAEIIDMAFSQLGLHRIEAGTLLDNVGSQRVLERNGFVRYGMAPQYLYFGGRWQDHVLYQLIRPDPGRQA